MLCKHLSWIKRGLTSIAAGAALLAAIGSSEPAENGVSAPKFVGASSCSSSSCHGGAADRQNQFEIWSTKDSHSRSFATLTTARSARIAETLKIANPAEDRQCTVCHAPFHELPAERRTAAVDSLQGVSCETCHGAAEPWLRSHTRKDYSHAQRVTAGMRELRTASGRANACVACHQAIDPTLLRAGHPELIFELDGQTASQPRHWNKTNDLASATLWLAGQTAALREMSWQLMRVTNAEPRQIQAWQGLAWVLGVPTEPSRENLQKAFELVTEGGADGILQRLIASAAEFRDKSIPQAVQARRAERLVLALDRLSGGSTRNLDDLFSAVQSLPDFDPVEFARILER